MTKDVDVEPARPACPGRRRFCPAGVCQDYGAWDRAALSSLKMISEVSDRSDALSMVDAWIPATIVLRGRDGVVPVGQDDGFDGWARTDP